MRRIMREILAPAGAREQLEAAVRSGADAVYFGASGFNARRNAENFGREEFLSAVRYCRERGVKSYITLNTLVKDGELSELYDTVALIAESGADAVIVQDMAVARTVRECCPSLPLHASTQMAVHNVSGAKALCENGFARIVLARELSVKEIKEIASAVPAEIEVFVHGAHCMSASGMCYMSSALGARSGNRGLCAQPCRLDFRADGREYALSLKDMCLAERLAELDEAGVTSFKIEGRMKRPEYVAAAVTAYRAACEGGVPDTGTLRSVFSRSGFTDGYAAGKRTLDMFGHRTKEDVTAAQGVLSGLKNLYKDEYKRVALDMRFKASENEECPLTVTDGENTVTVRGAKPEKARNLPLTAEAAEKSLTKLGGTFYYPGAFDCEPGEGIMLPAAAMNALRREACERLTVLRGEKAPHIFTRPEEVPSVSRKRTEMKLRLRFRRASQIPDGVSAEMLILPLSECTDGVTEKYGSLLCAELPALIYPADEEKTLAKLLALKEKGAEKVWCNNIGASALVKKAGLTPIGGPLLNVMNSVALAEYAALGVTDMTVSFETAFKDISELKTASRIGFIAYGHLPLMHFRCCPMQGKNGCGGCTGERILKDRRNEDFTVLCEERRYSVLYNPVPLYTGDRKMPAVDFAVLYFTSESREDCAKIIKSFLAGESLPCRRTAGLYDKVLL